uniref:Ig-like domain-containing protein n=1 Tax=Anopheles epiroticus TaxID=199890 RepID=A0A182PLW4_9DIPT
MRFVSAPPTSIQIQGYSQHAKAEVREGQNLSLTCVVPHARPAAQIVWYRANVEYKPVDHEGEVESVTAPEPHRTGTAPHKMLSGESVTEN